MPDEYVAVQIKDLKAGDRAIMYGTVVEITADPYKEDGMVQDWIRVPMKDRGTRLAPPEMGDWLVAIQKRTGNGSAGTDTPET
jgi:hypothetical protein